MVADAEAGFKPKVGAAAEAAGPAGPRAPRQSHKLSAGLYEPATRGLADKIATLLEVRPKP